LSSPFAGMTRIRFKGFLSARNGHPSEQCLMYARGQACQCGVPETVYTSVLPHAYAGTQ